MYGYFRRVLEKISSSLKIAYPDEIVSVYAFGSRARGDHRGDSDFDVLVVVRNKSVRLEEGIIELFVDEEMKSGISFDPVIKSADSFELEKRYQTPFYQNIVTEGIAV